MTGISIYDLLETDLEAEENGKWFEDILGNDTGIDVKVRRGNSQIAAKNLQRHMTAARKFLVKNKLPPEVDKRLLIEHVAECILLDWRGVNDRDGNPIPFSKESATLVLTKLPEFLKAVRVISDTLDNFKAETREEVAGN